MLAFVVLVSAVSIGWALNSPEKAIAPEEESGTTEIVLQTFSEAEYLPYESAFTDFTSLSGVSLVNIVGDRLVIRAFGVSSSTSSSVTFDYVVSYCGACQIPMTNGGAWTLYFVDGMTSPSGGCWRCEATQVPASNFQDVLTYIP